MVLAISGIGPEVGRSGRSSPRLMVDVRIVLFDGGPAVTSGIDLGLQPSPACRGRGSTDPERLFGLERRGTPWVAA